MSRWLIRREIRGLLVDGFDDILRHALRGRRRDDHAMKLCPQVIPTPAQNLPVLLVVSSLEDDGTNLDLGQCLGGDFIDDRLAQLLLPQAADAIHAADLLLNHAGVPFGETRSIEWRDLF